MKSTGTPDSIIDLLVAMSAPNKFRIEKNEQIAVEASSTSRRQNGEANSYTYIVEPPYYYGYYYPWSYYWTYYSPFWWGYPFYTYPGVVVGGGGGGGGGSSAGGGPSGNSEGRLSSGSGYVQITPRDTGRQAVPRGNAAPGARNAAPSGGSTGYSAGVGAASSGAGYSAGAASVPSGGGSVSSGASASPSGYSSGGNSGTAVPR